MFNALKGRGLRRASGKCISGWECGAKIGGEGDGAVGSDVTEKPAAVGV
jgi:hypothetical protein